MAQCAKCHALGKVAEASERFLVQDAESRRIVFHGYLCQAHVENFRRKAKVVHADQGKVI